jgi:hypothetical protein
LTDVLKSTIEKAADRLKNELASERKLKTTAFFVKADGTMKIVALSVKNEFQKDALSRRIQEKVSAKNISTVITLTEMDYEHTAVLSGVNSETRAPSAWTIIVITKQRLSLHGRFGSTSLFRMAFSTRRIREVVL